MSKEGPATIMEYLRRLEYERKMEKLYKRKSSFHGVALAEHSHRVKRTNAFETSTLRTKMDIIHKEEQSSKHYRKKNLTALHNLENSITGPVSCTIPGTTRDDIRAVERDKALAQRIRRPRTASTLIPDKPAASAAEGKPGAGEESQRQSSAPVPPKSAISNRTVSAHPSTATGQRKRVTIKSGRKPVYKQPNRQPRSRTELQNSLKYEDPPCAEEIRKKSASRKY